MRADVQPLAKVTYQTLGKCRTYLIACGPRTETAKGQTTGIRVGSYEKITSIRGAALYAHGIAWDEKRGGAVHLDCPQGWTRPVAGP